MPRTLDTQDEVIHLDIKGRAPGRRFQVTADGMSSIHYQGFGLQLVDVVKAELASYPSPEQIATEYGGNFWDVAIFEGTILAAVLLGREGRPPRVWYPGGKP